MNAKSLSRHAPVLALIFLTLTWGYNWVLVKQGLDYAGPFAFSAQRNVSGALALLLALKWLKRPLRLPAPGMVLAIGLVQGGGFMVLQTWALVEGGAGKTAVLIFTMPIWTLLMAWPLLGERIRGRQWGVAATAAVGLLLIIAPWNLHTTLFSKFLGVMAALCWAGGNILIKRLRSRHPVDLLVLTTWQLIIGAVLLVALAAVVAEPPTKWGGTFIGILAYMSVVSTGLCWFLWVYILDRLPAWEASLSVLGTPVVAILSSRLTFGEEFQATEVAGILLIGSGLVLLSLLSWAASRRNPGAHRDLAGEKK